MFLCPEVHFVTGYFFSKFKYTCFSGTGGSTEAPPVYQIVLKIVRFFCIFFFKISQNVTPSKGRHPHVSAPVPLVLG